MIHSSSFSEPDQVLKLDLLVQPLNWTAMAPMTNKRTAFSAFVTADQEKIFAFGEKDGTTIEYYSISANTWTLLTKTLPSNALAARLTAYGDEVWIIRLQRISVFNMATATWTTNDETFEQKGR